MFYLIHSPGPVSSDEGGDTMDRFFLDDLFLRRFDFVPFSKSAFESAVLSRRVGITRTLGAILFLPYPDDV